MCVNSTCSLRSQCYRYLEVPGFWQPVARFEPESDEYCQRFIKVQVGEAVLKVAEVDLRNAKKEPDV